MNIPRAKQTLAQAGLMPPAWVWGRVETFCIDRPLREVPRRAGDSFVQVEAGPYIIYTLYDAAGAVLFQATVEAASLRTQKN